MNRKSSKTHECSIESKCAIWKVEEGDIEIATQMRDFLDKHYTHVLDFFEENINSQNLMIHIFPTKKQYDRAVSENWKGNVPEWVIGNYKNNTINYVSFRDYKHTVHADKSFEYYLKTLLHEYVHFATDVYCKKHSLEHPMKYISEGLAYYLSGQGDQVKWKGKITVEDVLQSSNSYSTWFLLVQYVIENKGKAYFMELLKNKKLAEEKVEELVEEVNQSASKI